jgi:hypothetical protein
MNTAELLHIDSERLIRDGEAAVVAYDKHVEDACAKILPMARGIFAARKKYRADADFGRWRKSSPYNKINHTDRAALIAIGEHEMFAKAFLRTTHLISPRLIWGAMEDLLESARAPTVSHDVKPSMAMMKPEPDQLHDGEATDHAPEHAVGQPPPEPIGANPISAISGPAGRNRDDIISLFSKNGARATVREAIKDRRVKRCFNKAINAGLLAANDRDFGSPTLGMLFPMAPPHGFVRRFNLTNPKHLKHVDEILLPKMIECRDELLVDPARIEEILKGYDERKRRTETESAERVRRESALANLRPGEREVVMYGRQLWPRILPMEYNYDELTAAVAFFDEAQSMAEFVGNGSPETRAVKVRALIMWQKQLNNRLPHSEAQAVWRRFLMLVGELTRALEQNPNGPCIKPLRPDIDRGDISK